MLFRRLPWLTLPLSLLIWLCGCAAPPKPAAPLQGALPTSAAFVSPRDDLGREIVLKTPARRVIAIGPGAVETIFAIGGQNVLIGRDSYADFPAQAKKIAVAGDYQGPNIEQSVALRPDLVLVQGETWDKARVENWQNQIGVPVAALVATDIDGVTGGIEKIGKWLGRSARAHQIAADIRPLPGKRAILTQTAFVEIGRSPLYTAGQKTLVSDVLDAGDWNNVAKVSGYQPYGIESLLASQPDVYIAPTKATPKQLLMQLRQTPALSKLKCVQAGRVVAIDPDWLLRPGPRLKLGIARLRAEAARLAPLQGF